jgi:hypothetical protein
MQMKLFFLLCLTSVFFACKKNKIIRDDYISLGYHQTQCSDAWATGTTDSITLVNVANYLNTQNIYFAGLSIKQVNPADLCLACTCKTGKIIYVSTFYDNTMKQKYQALGFK